MKTWHLGYLYGSLGKVVEFANKHSLKPGEILLLGDPTGGNNSRISVMYFAKKELSQV